MADHHLVTDLLPCLARLVLTQQLGDLHLSPVQQVRVVISSTALKTYDVKENFKTIFASFYIFLFYYCGTYLFYVHVALA